MEAVAKRRKTGQRTARENVDDLCDEGSFVEHGQLVLTPGTGLPRDAVGNIEVAFNVSFVEVRSDAADQVIDALRNTQLRGRRVTVRRDRNAR